MRIPIIFRITTILLFLALVPIRAGAERLEAPQSPPWSGADIPCSILSGDIAGTMAGNETKMYSVGLSPGAYTIAAWASWDLFSIRLTIKDEAGNELARDEGRDNYPVCAIFLEAATTVQIELQAGIARMNGVDGSYAVAIASGSGCFERPDSYAKEILDEWSMVVTLENAEIMDWMVTEISGARTAKYEFSLSSGRYTVVAETVHPTDDIDMYVKLESDDVLKGNELPDNYPICYFELDRAHTVTIEIDPFLYAEGSSTGLVLVLARDTGPEE
jgi:hypothetical protein